MKRVLFIISVLIVGIIATAEIKVPLDGKITGGKPRSQTQDQPVEVLQSENELIVNFLDCLGNLTIKVVDEKGMAVFNQTVNTCLTSTISINIAGWDVGNYTISISDMGGGWLEGGFEIK